MARSRAGILCRSTWGFSEAASCLHVDFSESGEVNKSFLSAVEDVLKLAINFGVTLASADFL